MSSASLGRNAQGNENTATQAQLGDDSEDMADLIQSLQGQWEDDVGLNIKVTGNEVDTLMKRFFFIVPCL